jgi:hypothetical protein
LLVAIVRRRESHDQLGTQIVGPEFQKRWQAQEWAEFEEQEYHLSRMADEEYRKKLEQQQNAPQTSQ